MIGRGLNSAGRGKLRAQLLIGCWICHVYGLYCYSNSKHFDWMVLCLGRGAVVGSYLSWVCTDGACLMKWMVHGDVISGTRACLLSVQVPVVTKGTVQ